MSDMSELALTAVGGVGGGAAFVTWLLRRGAKAEERAEGEAAKKLDQLLVEVGVLKADVRVLVNDLGSHAAVVREVKERVDGISKNYGERLAKLEEITVELRTLLSVRGRK